MQTSMQSRKRCTYSSDSFRHVSKKAIIGYRLMVAFCIECAGIRKNLSYEAGQTDDILLMGG